MHKNAEITADTDYRIEKDSMGEILVPKNKLWGAVTQRAFDNFKISNEKMPKELIDGLIIVKRAAALTNKRLAKLDSHIADAIVQAADEYFTGYIAATEFPLPIWQTGSGTQSNMNVNEVLANRASQILGGGVGVERIVHPNDHVNKSQSSNDVMPTAIHIAAIKGLTENLLPALADLKQVLMIKQAEFTNIVKNGRTHLQDATPLTLAQEFSGYVTQLEHAEQHIQDGLPHLYELALGGTAVGTGLNAPKGFDIAVANEIANYTQHPFITASNKFAALAARDAVVYAHGALKTLAASLNKIANDFRWLASGPRGGIAELILPENEPGSSIMPGKVNPTQCEAITMIVAQVMGNDVTINIGGMSGNFELNVFKPVIAYNFIQSVRILTDGMLSFSRNCVQGIRANTKRIQSLVDNSLMLVTALTPKIGYDKAAEIAKKAYKEDTTLKAAALALGYVSAAEFDTIVVPMNMVGD